MKQQQQRKPIAPKRRDQPQPKQRKIGCQSFEIEVDGEIVKGTGRFSGPITQADRDAIVGVARALKRHMHADSVQSVTLTKP